MKKLAIFQISQVHFIISMNKIILQCQRFVTRSPSSCPSYTNTFLPPCSSRLPASVFYFPMRNASDSSRWKFWSKKKDNLKEDEVETLSEVDLYHQQQEEYRKAEEMELIQLKRNKSKLSASDRQILKGEAPNIGLRFEYSRHHHSQTFKREMLGSYGAKQTGVDPGICWPTDEHLDLAKEWESLYMEKPLIEQIKDVKTGIVKRKEDRIAREKVVDDGLARMENQIKQWRTRVNSRNMQAEKDRLRKEKILAELREEFGYNVNPNDNYMKERIAEKEKAILKAEKEAKKALKKEKLGAKQ